MNSIKPQNLKCPWFKLLALTTIILYSCNRKPTACVEVSPNTVQLGEATTISDCSSYGNDNEVKTGEGANFSNVSEMKWSYSTPGRYNVTLKTFSVKGNKDDKAAHAVTVLSPDSNELFTSWRATSVELREQLFVDPRIGIFDNLLVSTTEINEVYQFRGDSLLVSHHHENYNLFLNAYSMAYNYELAAFKVGDLNFDIVLYNGQQMILQGYYYKGYSLIYLSKV